MRLYCEIVKDLLPLYSDGVCSNESRIMVEEHLVECDSCKAELQAMKDGLFSSHQEQNLKEAEAVKKLSRRWKMGIVKSLLNGVLMTLLVIAVIALVLYLFMDLRVVPKHY